MNLGNSVDFYPIVLAYFRENSLVDPQIKSFNKFLEEGLQEVINSFKEIELIEGYKLVLGKLSVDKPVVYEYDGAKLSIYPAEARLRDTTYQAPMYLDIKIYSSGMELKTERIQLGHLPIMVRSKACRLSDLGEGRSLEDVGEDPLDPGGYFIINGSERVLVIRDDIAPNKIIVEEARAENKPYSHSAQVVSEKAGFRSRLFMEYYLSEGTIKASVGGLRKIPVAIFFKALGLVRDSDILNAISTNPEISNEFLYSIEEAQRTLKSEGPPSQEDALDYIGRRLVQGAPKRDRIRVAKDYLKTRFLPHLGDKESDFKVKAYYLAKMIEKLIRVVKGMCEPDDKDHFSNKRLRLAGNLMQELFRDAFYQYIRRLKEKADDKLAQGVYDLELKKLVGTEMYITKRIMRALATGAWPRGELGISQNLERTNYIATIHHLRRVNSSLPAGLPLHEVRQIHGTSVGRLCPLETPEGTNVGLVRSLALMANVTYGVDASIIINSLLDWGMKPIEEASPEEVGSLVPVYVNGKLVGLTDKPNDLVAFVKEKRREISHEINVTYIPEENAVYVNADAGRIQRPLIPVDKLDEVISLLDKIKNGEISFSELFRRGLIELLDPDEEESALVAYTLEEARKSGYTHFDFAPYASLGVAAGQIPYAEHNAIPRDIIGGNMVRQGIGVYATNWRLRTDSRSYIMFYPQKPIVYTRSAEIVGYHVRPSGQNLVVALMPMDAYNMDDAVVLNKGAVDRGMARIMTFRTYKAVAKRQAVIEGDRIENPLPLKDVIGKREEQYYQKLGEDGIVDPETYVSGGDILIGRTSPPRFAHRLTGTGWFSFTFERRDTSVPMRAWEEGYVNDVYLITTPNGERLVKVRVREVRPPVIGDKFATRHGQKGVVGMIFNEEDMPFTASGIVPDIILDPHAIPSRMTIGQLIEILAGKLGCLKGEFIDGTPFMNEKVEDLMEALKKLGFEYGGLEIMYDGRTGEMIKAPIFIGVGFYQRLKHLVKDKVHARSRGQMQLLTKQPVEGRARGGGLRLGEMEGEVLISHGAAAMLKDRYIENSDKEIAYICKRCNSLAYFNVHTNQFYCPRCRDNVEVYPIVTSHASTLLIKELMSGLVDVRMEVEEDL